MSRWRLAVLIALVAAPVVFLLAVGAYALWQSGWGFWVWWPMSACLALAYFLGWRWQRKFRLLRLDFDAPLHWTDRDRRAWQLVEARAKAAPTLDPDKLSTVPFTWRPPRRWPWSWRGFTTPRPRTPSPR